MYLLIELYRIETRNIRTQHSCIRLLIELYRIETTEQGGKGEQERKTFNRTI